MIYAGRTLLRPAAAFVLLAGFVHPAAAAPPGAAKPPAAPQVDVLAGKLNTAADPVAPPVAHRRPRAIPSPVPAGLPGHEVASAKALLTRLGTMQRLDQLPPLLTNDSAATMGVMFGGFVYLMTTFGDMAAGMAEGAANAAGQPAGGLDPAKAKGLQQLKAMQGEIEGIFRTYGLDFQSLPTGGIPPGLRANGRSMLSDVLHVLDRLPSKPGAGPGPNGLRMPAVSAARMRSELKRARYTVVGRSRVRITGVDKAGKKQSLEACIEDGGWRLSIGDLAKMTGAPGSAPGADAGGMRAVPAP